MRFNIGGPNQWCRRSIIVPADRTTKPQLCLLFSTRSLGLVAFSSGQIKNSTLFAVISFIKNSRARYKVGLLGMFNFITCFPFWNIFLVLSGGESQFLDSRHATEPTTRGAPTRL